MPGTNANYYDLSGGGVWCESSSAVLSNCVLIGNSADWSGGGAFGGTLVSCVLADNSANIGGGACEAILNRCILTNNFTDGDGSAALYSTLTGCIATRNTAVEGLTVGFSTLNNCTLAGNTWERGVDECALNNCILSEINILNYGSNVFNYCCTTPLPDHGIGNFTNAPIFVDLAGGNLRLQSNSPCINAGNNAYVTSSTDLDGNPRIVGGTVDIGAYEFQSPSSVLSYVWAQQYGLPTDGSADFSDADGDSMNNWGEWISGTVPTNALSALRLVSATNGPSGLKVTWQSVSTRTYCLERATNLGDAPPFQSIATNIAGASGSRTYTDTSATNGGPYYYRVGVQ